MFDFYGNIVELFHVKILNNNILKGQNKRL